MSSLKYKYLSVFQLLSFYLNLHVLYHKKTFFKNCNNTEWNLGKFILLNYGNKEFIHQSFT